MKFRITSIASAAIMAAGFVFAAAPAQAGHKDSHGGPCSIISKYDRDKDGKMNIFEAKRAGKVLWKKLNPDNDFTLEYDEVDKRISPSEFKKWNKIGRKGLDRIEWTRLVKHRFKAANPDNDRTIECDELHTDAGHDFLAVTFH
ncbi:MAG: EF-hand domain-containing protein [Pseudomonadota bacterium]